MRVALVVLVAAAATSLLSPTSPPAAAAVAAIRALDGFAANVLPTGTSTSSGAVNIGFPVNVAGTTRTTLFVNTNGNVTFDSPRGVLSLTDLQANTGRPMLAPFLADVDTSGAKSAKVTYGTGTISGRPAFGVNWLDVGYFENRDDKLNGFQLVLLDRSDVAPGAFDVEFNYRNIAWEAGNNNRGVNGLGGDTARAGFSDGTGTFDGFFELPGSGAPGAFLDSNATTGLANVNGGRTSFGLRNGLYLYSGGAVGNDDRAVTPNETPVTIDPVANDLGLVPMVSLAVVAGPANGRAVVRQAVTYILPPTIVYTPNAGFAGVDRLTYVATDGEHRRVSASIAITVIGATPLTGTSTLGRAITLDPLAALPGARESELPITVTIPTPAVRAAAATTHGDAVANRDGTITYTPTTGFTGVDSFPYAMKTADAPTSTSVVTVDVPPSTTTTSIAPTTTTTATVAVSTATTVPVTVSTTTVAVETTTTSVAVPVTVASGPVASVVSTVEAITVDSGATTTTTTRSTTTTAPRKKAAAVAPPQKTEVAAASSSRAAPSTGIGRTASLVVVTPDGSTVGPPGITVDVAGDGYGARCASVYIFFDGQRIGTASVDSNGAFHKRGLSVPGDVGAGRRQVTTSCQANGKQVVQTTTFDVRKASVHRTAFATSLTQPRQLVTSMKQIATSALIAALLLLFIAFPAELFNSTLEENYEEVKGWFARLHRSTTATTFKLRTQTGHMVAMLLAAGVLYGLLSPSFGFNRSSVLMVIATVGALSVVTAALEGTQLFCHGRRHRGALRLLPGTVVVAAVCVLVSRLVHLQPGYCYGLIGSAVFVGELSDREDGRIMALASAVTLAVGTLAWVVWVPVSAAAGRPGAGTGVLALDSVLAAVFVAALGTVLFGLVPLRFMDGATVMRWSRTAWALLFGAAVFALVHILLRPGTGFVSTSSGGPLLSIVVAFVGFGLISVAFWGYFRFRPTSPLQQGVEGDAQVVDQIGGRL